jgi:hypothetical protein
MVKTKLLNLKEDLQMN